MSSKIQSLAVLAAALTSTLVTASPIRRQLDVVTSSNPADVLKRSIHKRETTSVTCGVWSTGNWADIGKGLSDSSDESVPIPAQSCGRIGCYDTSGIYICNDNDYDIDVPMSEASAQTDFLLDVCHKSAGEGYYYVSGQTFSTNYGGYNLNIGYCDNNHPNSASPSDYGAGFYPGPNGNPDVTCDGNTGVPCEGVTCLEGTIRQDTQESIQCNDFLGPAYAGPGVTATYSTVRTLGETWSVGGFLAIDTSDLAPVSVSVGFFSSYAKTVTIGTNAGISAECGTSTDGDYTCAMHISPRCWSMTGSCETEKLGTVPWANIAPQLDAEGGSPIFFPNICTCPNCPDSANPEAPKDICPMDCATCDPNV